MSPGVEILRFFFSKEHFSALKKKGLQFSAGVEAGSFLAVWVGDWHLGI
jgi:hypothetical protein